MRRLLLLSTTAATTVLALVALPAQPASAEAAITIELPGAGALLTGTATVRFRASDDSLTQELRDWCVELVPGATGNYDRARVLRTGQFAGGNDAPPPVEFGWDTTRYPAAGSAGCTGTALRAGAEAPSANGTHRVRVAASTVSLVDGATRWTAEEVSVSLANAPAVPTGLRLEWVAEEDAILVEWDDANAEPDFEAYEPHECVVPTPANPCDDADWYVVTSVGRGDPDYDVICPSGTCGLLVPPREGAERQGVYRYRVNAARADGTRSAAATPATGPTQIVVDAASDPPSSTPTTAKTPQGTGGGDGSGTGVQPGTRERVVRAVGQPAQPPVVQGGGQSRLEQRVIDAPDPGYDENLPYGARYREDEPASGRALELSTDDGGDDLRPVLLPMAAGVLFLVLALQARYALRRAEVRLEPVDPRAIGGDLNAGAAGVDTRAITRPLRARPRGR